MNNFVEILKRLLKIELSVQAKKFEFINTEVLIISESDLFDTISLLNYLSNKGDDYSKRQVIILSALLWTHRKMEWNGLKDYLMMFLSRAGFSPSTTMIDSEYDNEAKTFSPLNSLLNQLSITLSQIKYEIEIESVQYLLTEYQYKIWEEISNNKLIGISAPTSSGKSFLILLKAIQLLKEKEGNIVYIVPTLSLVSQVLTDFKKLFDEFNLSHLRLESSYNLSIVDQKTVYVLTQEKAIAAFSQTDKPFDNIRMFVIDEIQNVERVGDWDEQRSKILYDVMIELNHSSNIDHIIISGPRIDDIDKLGFKIFKIDCIKAETKSSPVLNLTYSLSKKKSVFYFNLYSDLLNDPIQIKIDSYKNINGYGGVIYNKSYFEFFNSFISNFSEYETNVIFSPTSNTCSKIANSIYSTKDYIANEYLESLSEFISNTVHQSFNLVDLVKKSIAYHHGKLPVHIRLVIEDGVKLKKIKTLVCTTTLMQGVNLPIQNIIIRNPNLFIRTRDNSTKLSNYEIANLSGRAGRLLKDFIGRTFILDESSFESEDTNQFDLFKDSSKELKVGYGNTFEIFEKEIKQDILDGIGSVSKNEEYSYLLTYIRQIVLRHADKAQTYLRNVGIEISSNEISKIEQSLKNLSIPSDICIKNRYWDPIDLDKLFSISSLLKAPMNITEDFIASKLENLLNSLKKVFPIYYKKYFDVNDVSGKKIILQKCILAENWLKEKTLYEILSNEYYDKPEKIDDTINFIQSKISYGLPMLLKPLYDILKNELFPLYIELGAFKPITRKLIELNIPRETAIFLSKNFNFTDANDRVKIISELRKIKTNLSYWHQIQMISI